jgi:asparagine synthase (glutamine-hydrolysing)
MCGLTGYRSFGAEPQALAGQLDAATRAIEHRGPDDSGQWIGADGRVGFGHRRLAIVDLSPLGHQPMRSACGRWTMVFNGEIYNFKSIRAELESLGHRFRGTGDSEVILAGFSQWGPEAVKRFIGMFAIALWHEPTGELHLLRDRLGVKPLYYHWDGKLLVFGSELKALRAFTGWEPEVDREALVDYLRYGYINDPRTIYRNVCKLPPAHRLVLDAQGGLALHCYWNVLDHVGARRTRSEAELEEELEALLIDAFRLRMIADVPVGVFLSGGVDSSLVAAILQKHGGQPIKTYTIGFDRPEFDESPHAAAVARHLGTEHHCRMLQVDDAKRLLPRWGELYDEPFGDESGIPTLMVSQAAAEQVKVVLSADGGDELFSGYNGYRTTLEQWQRVQGLPLGMRRAGAALINGLGVAGIDDWLAENAPAAGLMHRLRSRGTQRFAAIGQRVASRGVGELFDRALAHFRDDELARLVGDGRATRRNADAYPGEAGEKLCLWDLHNYMPGDVLTKVDRATMAVSIEGREPLIDHRLVEFAYSLPFEMRRGTLGAKHLLKKVLYRYVPRELVDRPKRGFGVPVKPWLASDLLPLVREHLDARELSRQGLFDPALVARWLTRLQAGDASVQQRVWLLVAFQMWHRRWMGDASTVDALAA